MCARGLFPTLSVYLCSIMAASLTNASTNTTGTAIAITGNVTITVTGDLTLPAQVVIKYSTDNSTFIKTGLAFGTTGVFDIDLNSGAGWLRADLEDAGDYVGKSVDVSVDIS